MVNAEEDHAVSFTRAFGSAAAAVLRARRVGQLVGIGDEHTRQLQALVVTGEAPAADGAARFAAASGFGAQVRRVRRAVRTQDIAFNPVQTQVFQCLYNTTTTRSWARPRAAGRRCAPSLPFFGCATSSKRARLRGRSACTCAPTPEIARERLTDWRGRFGEKLPG